MGRDGKRWSSPGASLKQGSNSSSHSCRRLWGRQYEAISESSITEHSESRALRSRRDGKTRKAIRVNNTIRPERLHPERVQFLAVTLHMAVMLHTLATARAPATAYTSRRELVD